MKTLAPYLLIALALLGSCAQNQSYLTSEQKLRKADELFARKKYSRAAELYQDVYFERASGSTAYALMRQADSYFAVNKFTDARTAYQEFTDAFPNHPDVSTAHFKIGVCLYEESLPPQYDQTETLHSIDAFRNFIAKYPNDPRYKDALDYVRKAQYKLIEKKYLTGYIEYKMKDYSAALMYFHEVIDLGNNDRLDRMSLYYSTLIYLKQEQRDKALGAYDTLSGKYPGSKETKKLAKYFK